MKIKIRVVFVSFLILMVSSVYSQNILEDGIVFKTTCTNCSIRIFASNFNPVKVTGFYYHDIKAKKWRLISMLPQVIKKDSYKYLNRRLRYVKDKETYLKVVFKYGYKNKRGKYKYKGKKYEYFSRKFKCSGDNYIDISIPNPIYYNR